MHNMQLEISEWGLAFGVLLLVLTLFLQWQYRKNENSPSLFYSDLENIQSVDKTWRVRLVSLPSWLKKGAFMMFIFALCNPILLKPIQEKPDSLSSELGSEGQDVPHFENRRIPSEGLAIYFILDQSGSMREEVDIALKGYGSKRVTRIDALKFFTSQFILGNKELGMAGRPDDLIGLIAFARVPKIIAPLTLDHEDIKQKLSHFSPVNNAKEEGTAIGYAIYKTAHTIAATEHFSKSLVGEDKPAYDIKSTVMILVTDGLQNPSHEDLDHPLRSISIEQAAHFAKEKNIRLYIINIQPGIDFPELRAERNTQKRAAELTGGEFFLAADTQALHQIYKVIDSLERSKHYGTDKHTIEVEERVTSSKNREEFEKTFLFIHMTSLGMVLLFMAIFLETTLLKKVP